MSLKLPDAMYFWGNTFQSKHNFSAQFYTKKILGLYYLSSKASLR